MYVSRRLENAEDLVAWAKEQGFKTTIPADELHVTIAFSRALLEWPKKSGVSVTVSAGERSVKRLGETGEAVVLRFESEALTERWQELVDLGASWDFDGGGYKPHVTISWDAADLNLDEVEPYLGPLIFLPERFEELNEDWKDNRD